MENNVKATYRRTESSRSVGGGESVESYSVTSLTFATEEKKETDTMITVVRIGTSCPWGFESKHATDLTWGSGPASGMQAKNAVESHASSHSTTR